MDGSQMQMMFVNGMLIFHEEPDKQNEEMPLVLCLEYTFKRISTTETAGQFE
jgi:hypothetical protein